MRQFLHVYRMDGGYKYGILIPKRDLDGPEGASLTSRIQYMLIANGYTLIQWHEQEQAGIIRANGTDEYLIRVKGDNMPKSMMAIGAQQMVSTIRSDGVPVEVLTGRLAD